LVNGSWQGKFAPQWENLLGYRFGCWTDLSSLFLICCVFGVERRILLGQRKIHKEVIQLANQPGHHHSRDLPLLGAIPYQKLRQFDR
jgi:hypothetical protein